MVAAESVFEALKAGDEGAQELASFTQKWEASWAYELLKESASFGPAMHKYGTVGGSTYNFVNQFLGNKLPMFTTRPLHYGALKPAAKFEKINYPKPDGKLSFDKSSSVFLSNTRSRRRTTRATCTWTILTFRLSTTYPSMPSRPSVTALQACMKW